MALTANACGQSAWSKLPRILRVWGLAIGRLERPNNRGQAWTPHNNRGLWPKCLGQTAGPNNRWLWRQTASLMALTANACGQSAWSKLPRSIEAFEANKNKFHTCGGPRCRPCLGEGRGRRILPSTAIWPETVDQTMKDGDLIWIKAIEKLGFYGKQTPDNHQQKMGIQPNIRGRFRAMFTSTTYSNDF